MTSLIRWVCPPLQDLAGWKSCLSKAGLSTLYTSGALDGLSDEAKEDLLRKSRVFYFNQYALPLTSDSTFGKFPSEFTDRTYPSPTQNN